MDTATDKIQFLTCVTSYFCFSFQNEIFQPCARQYVCQHWLTHMLTQDLGRERSSISFPCSIIPNEINVFSAKC